jgi:hypothetical protein
LPIFAEPINQKYRIVIGTILVIATIVMVVIVMKQHKKANQPLVESLN